MRRNDRPRAHAALAESAGDDAPRSGGGTQAHSEHALTFTNQGARVRVCANAPRALELVQQRLPVGSQIDPSNSPDALFSISVPVGVRADDAPHRLYRDSALLQSSRDLDELLERLESELHFAVASNARSALFVHAGVVGWQGRGILLPGPSMSGKSSLVTALLRAGAEYYSDEYAVIDAEGHVHPYAKPLGLRVPGGGTRPTTPESIGCRIGTRPLRARVIVSTRYEQGACFEPEGRDPSRGLMVLIANTVVMRDRPRFALNHLTPVVGAATTLEGVRGDADEAAAWLLRYCDGSRPGSVPYGLRAIEQ